MALVIVGWMVIPFTRQLTFGPKIEGIPLCQLQNDLCRTALGAEYRPDFLDKIGEYLQLDKPMNALSLLSDDGRRRVNLSMVDDQQPKVRRYALNALQWYVSSPEVLEAFVRARDDPDPQCRMIAAGGIFHSSNDEPLIMNTFARSFNDPDKLVRSAAYCFLCDKLDDATVLRFVPRVVDKIDPKVRVLVVSRIWRVQGTPENIDSLTLMLKDVHSQWRVSAACAVYRHGKCDPETLSVIRTGLQNNKDDFHDTLRFVATAPSLAKEFLPEIAAVAENNTDYTSRSYAVYAMGQCGAKAVPYLVSMLENAGWPLQTTCIYALGNIGSDARDAIPHLRALLKDSRVDVRRAVNEALVRIDPTFVPQEKFEPLPTMLFGPIGK
jgi:HEAT repeat protein